MKPQNMWPRHCMHAAQRILDAPATDSAVSSNVLLKLKRSACTQTAIGHWGETMFPLFSILKREASFAWPPAQFVLLHLKRVGSRAFKTHAVCLIAAHQPLL